ncbi:GDSL-type esterase/lipase family protein [Georgenia satyanarayanai]|uniref:GDSL-type esterase/lipase family protein n=1 Tax=Georgenia satyanarayanai TaxID=860221 RepID=UPI001264D55B|nr:GDSL-type esterase/lipase family protein [Georgenia satyanarayanai]
MGESWTRTPITTDVLRGVLALERGAHGVVPHRLPAWARAQCTDPQLHLAEGQPAGARFALRTAATVVELDVLPTRYGFRGAPPRPEGVFDLLVDGILVAQAVAPTATTVTIDMATGAAEHEPGEVGTVRFAGLPAGVKDLELWLPHNEALELVALRTDAPVEAPAGTARRRWVHHGSSISHGSNAEHPTGPWPALVALGGGLDLLNLGLSGSALLDPFVARTMRDAPADLLSVKIGINVVGGDVMRRRVFGPAVHGFLDTLREGHPTTPLLVVSPLHTPIHEDTPGPGAFDLDALAAGRTAFRATGDPAEVAAGKLTLTVVREELAAVVAQRAATDAHLFYLDGRELYGVGDHAELPLPDELHPDGATHRRIAERFSARVLGGGGPFGQAPAA